jgi:hypothetical protein
MSAFLRALRTTRRWQERVVPDGKIALIRMVSAHTHSGTFVMNVVMTEVINDGLLICELDMI